MPDSNLFNQDDRSYLERLADDYGLDSRSTFEEYMEVVLELLGKPETLKAGMELVMGREISHQEFTRAPLGLMNNTNNPEALHEDLVEYREIMERAKRLSEKVQNKQNESESEV